MKSTLRRITRSWRLLTLTSVLIAIVGASGLVGAGWYYADQLRDQAFSAEREPKTFDLLIEDVTRDSVTLRVTGQTNPDGLWTKRGVYGLEWDGGYAQVSTIKQLSADRVVREVRVFEGNLQPGIRTRIDPFAFPGDPRRAFGIPFEEVAIEHPLGVFPAWFVDAPGDSWAIMVHGRHASRAEMLRQLPVLHELRIKALVISYRNDEGAPADGERQVHFGATEWEELDSAAAYALDRGAKRLFLVGNSMGGSIVMSFLGRSPRSSGVVAAVLDAPMLDLEATVDFRAPGAVPDAVIWSGKRLASLRFGVNWGEVDYLSRADELKLPILLFHGDADQSVPVATSDLLARARADLVTYVRLPGVSHVRSWNADPAAYEAEMRAFLEPQLRAM